MPFLHDELMGNIELVENQVKYVDVISGRLSLGVNELKGAEVPVAYNNQRFLLGISELIVGGEGVPQGEKAEE
jgi:hypothetical protein